MYNNSDRNVYYSYHVLHYCYRHKVVWIII